MRRGLDEEKQFGGGSSGIRMRSVGRSWAVRSSNRGSREAHVGSGSFALAVYGGRGSQFGSSVRCMSENAGGGPLGGAYDTGVAMAVMKSVVAR